MSVDVTRLFLCGDVMLGRGVDQILAHPGDPILYEGWMRSALGYVALAERRCGPLPRKVAPEYVWGDLPEDLRAHGCDLRLINLECAVTTASDPVPKGINYRVHPANVPVLNALPIDAAVLANNHVMDWGPEGLAETLDVLHGAGIATTGAGRTAAEARSPVVRDLGSRRRVVVLSFGDETSGIPRDWIAGPDRPGVTALPKGPAAVAAEVRRCIDPFRRKGDIVIVSIHWGGNWGYLVPAEQRDIAHALVDLAGVHIVHGHSSHHPKALEIRNGRLILYGCGDLINDYEGISGHEEYRSELVLGYLVGIGPDGSVTSLLLLPYQVHAFRLQRAESDARKWLADTITHQCSEFGIRVILRLDGMLEAMAAESAPDRQNR